MKFSESWLRTFVDPSLSSGELASALTMAGIEVEVMEAVGTDQLFTIKPTPNRGDCLSVWGIAREVAAITGSPLLPVNTETVPAAVSDRMEIKLEAPTACPRYCARIVHAVNARAATSGWMKERLEAAGVRTISAIVDITNYVMLEFGQPLHAFDLAAVEGGIRVRFGRRGERLELLNEQEVTLDPNFLVIADEKKPLALAGIMGGRESAVQPATTDILIESAFFDPVAIAGKSRLLGFGSESSYRFERGVDFSTTAQAIERATKLILETCGGKAGPVCEVKATLPQRKPIRLRHARVKRLLGIEIGSRQIAEVLQRLKFVYQEQSDGFTVTPPSYRFDLAIEEDLIEEVARIYGYDRIPAHRPQSPAIMLPAPEKYMRLGELCGLLVARDYQEVVTYSFVDRSWESDFCSNDNPVVLLNPIAAHLGVMRSSLIASLVDCLKLNLSRQRERVRLFEIGRCFEHASVGYRQTMRLAALAYGGAVDEQWGAVNRRVDFYDIKSDLEALLTPNAVRFRPAQHPALHPGRAAEIRVNGASAGWLGELHPRLQQKYDLPFAPVVFELNLETITARPCATYHEISRLPIIRRDISVEMPGSVTWEAILKALQEHAPHTILEITPFDIYRGKGIDSDKKSVAFRVLLQDTSKTLTDAEVDVVVRQFVQVLEEKFDAMLRK